jgi:hypothetical protein
MNHSQCRNATVVAFARPLATERWLPGPGERWQDTKTWTLVALLCIVFMTVGLIRGTVRSSRPGGFFRQSKSIAIFYACLLAPIYCLMLFSVVVLIRALFK